MKVLNNRSLLFLCFLLWGGISVMAQSSEYRKMSLKVKQLALEQDAQHVVGRRSKAMGNADGRREITAFVRISGDAEAVLGKYGCRKLAQWGDICVAIIPLSKISALSASPQVLRIEANSGNSVNLDTTAVVHNVNAVYVGEGFTRGYTGKGVVVGLQDVGFDLTHPTFYNREGTEYRIRRFWDQLSPDSLNSKMTVGQEYTTGEDILNYAHSRDAEILWHGSHTAGTAAGSGAGTNYRGLAYESDICLVSNAVTEDTIYIEEDRRELFTSAMDALGFKYIFDYADQVGKPCVVSFSEGSLDDFHPDNQLFYETINRMVGPGRILVASAGNESYNKTFFLKSRGQDEVGTFLESSSYHSNALALNMLSNDAFTMKVHIFDNGTDHLFTCPTEDVLADADSLISDTLKVGNHEYVIHWNSYTPIGNYDGKILYQIFVIGPENIGVDQPISMSVEGRDAEVECYRYAGRFTTNELLPKLCAGEPIRNINVPSSSPDVICVGATWHRGTFLKDDGFYGSLDSGTPGKLSVYSSVGPTPDNLIKPDVVANGTVVSAGSSYYYDKYGRTYYDIALSKVGNRTYPWSMSCGTSMSTPIVAGIIALWLQAKPDLTPQDVKDILAASCRHPDETLQYPNNMYGYGEIDAAAGLHYLILTSVQEVTAEPRRSSVAYNLLGVPVDDSYRGIVIRDGRKYHQK